MTEIPKYIETQSVDDGIDTMNINRELIDSILEEKGVNYEVANNLYDKIINEISTIEVNSDDYIDKGATDFKGDINEGSIEEKEFFEKIAEDRNKALDSLLKSLGEYSDLNSLNELFKYDEKLSSIADGILNKEVEKEKIVGINTDDSNDNNIGGIGKFLMEITGLNKRDKEYNKKLASLDIDSRKIHY